MEPLQLALFLAGPLLLVVGAELLVRGAARLAAAAGLSPLVIGLTVVSYGTGTPELAVSLRAGLAGTGDIALGNIVGSNILNILLVLGLTATIAPIAVQGRLLRTEVPLMIGASLLTLGLALDGSLSRLDGAILLSGIIAFTVYALRSGKHFEQDKPASTTPIAIDVILRSVLSIAIGLAALVLGGDWIVDGAVAIARRAGVSELMIGLTIVAIGTSLPEIATSLIAVIRGQREIAVGNVVGSNLFNLLAVLGLTAAVIPGGIDVPRAAASFDLPVMVATAAACLPIFYRHGRIERWEGALLLGFFVAYLSYLGLVAAGQPISRQFGQAMLYFVLPLTAITLVALSVTYARRRPEAG